MLHRRGHPPSRGEIRCPVRFEPPVWCEIGHVATRARLLRRLREAELCSCSWARATRAALSRELNWAVRNLDAPVWGSGGGDGSPRLERLFSEDAERAAGGEKALDVEGVENGGVIACDGPDPVLCLQNARGADHRQDRPPRNIRETGDAGLLENDGGCARSRSPASAEQFVWLISGSIRLAYRRRGANG